MKKLLIIISALLLVGCTSKEITYNGGVREMNISTNTNEFMNIVIPEEISVADTNGLNFWELSDGSFFYVAPISYSDTDAILVESPDEENLYFRGNTELLEFILRSNKFDKQPLILSEEPKRWYDELDIVSVSINSADARQTIIPIGTFVKDPEGDFLTYSLITMLPNKRESVERLILKNYTTKDTEVFMKERGEEKIFFIKNSVLAKDVYLTLMRTSNNTYKVISSTDKYSAYVIQPFISADDSWKDVTKKSVK